MTYNSFLSTGRLKIYHLMNVPFETFSAVETENFHEALFAQQSFQLNRRKLISKERHLISKSMLGETVGGGKKNAISQKLEIQFSRDEETTMLIDEN